MTELTIKILEDAFVNRAAGIRAITALQPLGGKGDKVFPPTFGDTATIQLQNGERHQTRYAVEDRRIDGAAKRCVLLDSVASQANRLEEALQRAWDDGRLLFPMVRVDFTDAIDEDPDLDLSTLGGDGYLTALETPHRLADALLRDTMLKDLRFRASEPGRAFTEATPDNATPLYQLCPTALVFGMWDSTGPKGGLGSKFQRALVSEIVGVGVEFGRKTASRVDPAQIELQAGPVYAAEDAEEEWTLDEAEAKKEKGNPVPFQRKGKTQDKPGRPSHINHGNVTPSVDSEAGGVTLDYAQQTTVLSLPALRRLRFPKRVDGTPVPREERAAIERATHVTLAALGLASVAFQREEGFDLRSRCAFVPQGELAFEIVGRDGTRSDTYTLDSGQAMTLVAAAAAQAAELGMVWDAEPIDLTPAAKLVDLIRKSRKVAVRGEAEEA